MPLDARSGHDAIMAEVKRLCLDAGAPEAAAFYAWGDRGLWRVPDRSEPGPMDIGANREDMQRALEMDVASYVRLRARRDAIGDNAEPAWALAIGAATRALLEHAGVSACVPFDMVDDPGPMRRGLRVDTVRHRRGCVLAHIEIGATSQGEVCFDAYEDRSEIRMRDLALPQTVVAGLSGAALSSVMPHPVLDGLDLRVTLAETIPGWNAGDIDTVLHLESRWEPLQDHTSSRDWIMPVPLPRYGLTTRRSLSATFPSVQTP